MKRYERTCMFCGGLAAVLASPNASQLDVDAEFASAGRAFGTEDETEGVACHPCARKQWRKVGDYYDCCGEFGGCGGPCAAFPCWELTT